MVEEPSLPALRPNPRSPAVWMNALTAVVFIAFIVFAAEAVVAWIVGSFAGAGAAGWLAAAIMTLPTLWWLLFTCLPNALAAERDTPAPSVSG